MSHASFSLKVVTNKENLNKIEGFVEDVCDYYNIFNVYFGNILVATSEFHSFIGFLFPNKEVEVYSYLKRGALVVGFNLKDKFNEVATYLQKNNSQYIESEIISEEERSLLSTTLLSDDIILDFAHQKVEFFFNIKAEAKGRKVKISKYIESVAETPSVKTRHKG